MTKKEIIDMIHDEAHKALRGQLLYDKMATEATTAQDRTRWQAWALAEGHKLTTLQMMIDRIK